MEVRDGREARSDELKFCEGNARFAGGHVQLVAVEYNDIIFTASRKAEIQCDS
jgi:hypothetical protein